MKIEKSTIQAQVCYIGEIDLIPKGKQNDDVFGPNFASTGRVAKFSELLKLANRTNRMYHT